MTDTAPDMTIATRTVYTVAGHEFADESEARAYVRAESVRADAEAFAAETFPDQPRLAAAAVKTILAWEGWNAALGGEE